PRPYSSYSPACERSKTETKRNWLPPGSLGVLALAAVVAVQTASASSPGGTTVAFKAVCGAGPIRGLSLLRTDVPAIPGPDADHGGYGPAELRSAYKLASAAVKRGKGKTVAIVDAYDYPTAEQDLAVYRDLQLDPLGPLLRPS